MSRVKFYVHTLFKSSQSIRLLRRSKPVTNLKIYNKCNGNTFKFDRSISNSKYMVIFFFVFKTTTTLHLWKWIRLFCIMCQPHYIIIYLFDRYRLCPIRNLRGHTLQMFHIHCVAINNKNQRALCHHWYYLMGRRFVYNTWWSQWSNILKTRDLKLSSKKIYNIIVVIHKLVLV